MARNITAAGAIFAFLAVAFGAFATHALKGRLSPESMAVFQTATQYQMYHALALILIGLMANRSAGDRSIRTAGMLITAGIPLFSFTLYLYAVTGRTVFAMITPLGGLCFLAGWAALIIGLTRRSPHDGRTK